MKKKTFRNILGAILICTMLLAATIAALGSGAYFKDSETIENNYITIGTLDLDKANSISMSIIDLFPGGFKDHTISLENTGTLPIKYRMIASPTIDCSQSMLELVKVKVEVDNGSGSFTTVLNTTSLDTLLNYNEIRTVLQPGATHKHSLKFTFSIDANVEDIDRQLQGQLLEFDLLFEATQTNNPGW